MQGYMYNEDYFERGPQAGVSLYTNYSWQSELTIPMVSRMIEELGIAVADTVLDYGCAKGFVVKAFRLLGRQAWGMDVSNYAIEHCAQGMRRYLCHVDETQRAADWIWPEGFPYQFDWCICKDVLEHVETPEELHVVLIMLRAMCKNMFVVVPLGEDGVYNEPAYALDKTHHIAENVDWWLRAFHVAGFDYVRAGFEFPGVKENWKTHEKSNGFFISSCHNKPLSRDLTGCVESEKLVNGELASSDTQNDGEASR